MVTALLIGGFAIFNVLTTFAQVESCEEVEVACEDATPTETEEVIASETPTLTATSIPTETPEPSLTPTVEASATATATPEEPTETATTQPSATATLIPSNTPPPTATPLVINPVSACWVSDQGPSTSMWRIENPNRTPLRDTPETKLRFDWAVYVNDQAEAVQSASNYDNPAVFEMQTRRGDYLVVSWHLDEQGQAPVFLGETVAFAQPEYSCDSLIITLTAEASITPSATATETVIATATGTETATPTATDTVDLPTQESATPTATATDTPTDLPTVTPRESETPTSTATPTATPTLDSQDDFTATPTTEPTATVEPPAGCDVLVPSGMVEALAAEIEKANASGEATVICLQENGDYPLLTNYGTTSGLPTLTGNITIEGRNAMIRRGTMAPAVRLLHIRGGNVTLRNLTLTNGYAQGSQGGAILIERSDVVLDTLQIIGNRATNGGGIFIDETNATIIGSTFRDNQATASGGGLAVFDLVSSVGVFTTTINANTAVSGGGFANSSGTLVIENGTISNNIATNGGSFYNTDQGHLSISNSVISENSASFAAAGLTQTSYTAVSTSCLILNRTSSGTDFTNAVPIEQVNATNNWWGTADGPGGVGTGSGTTISSNVLYQPYLTTAPGICAATSQDFGTMPLTAPRGTRSR
ncbi:MAG: hypothetical protein KC496_13035 [Anaerolineae bacterium]|nr:hypothetical protein [Anaerolineae bacterium]